MIFLDDKARAKLLFALTSQSMVLNLMTKNNDAKSRTFYE